MQDALFFHVPKKKISVYVSLMSAPDVVFELYCPWFVIVHINCATRLPFCSESAHVVVLSCTLGAKPHKSGAGGSRRASDRPAFPSPTNIYTTKAALLLGEKRTQAYQLLSLIRLSHRERERRAAQVLKIKLAAPRRRWTKTRAAPS
jgi:hypothetical protein